MLRLIHRVDMNPLFKHPTAWIPLAMSIAALAIVLTHIALYGVVREADEGAAAHLFQILIAAQAPLIAVSAIRSLLRSPKQAARVLLVQAAAILAALLPVWYLRL
jgi:hypothetical protein